MQALLNNPVALGGIAAAIILLIIIAVAPSNLADLVGELFQLVGGLISALAGEAELAAEALFDILAGSFAYKEPENPKTATPSTGSAAPQQPAPSAASPTGSGAASSTAAPGSTDGTTATAQTTSAGPSRSTRFAWVVETIFVRLLYLATIIVIVASDFIFAILRLQAVLFPGLPLPKGGIFDNLSLLVGALLVSIVLLSGALTLDFFDVLPPPARLFPEIRPGMRRVLLFTSLIAFVLSTITVGGLFAAGQLLTSAGTSSPAGAIALATLIGVLQVLVVFLGAWGALRGLAVIFALLGGLVGVVLHLFALVLRWVGQAFEVIGTVVIPDLIWAIAAIFGRKRDRPVRPGGSTNVLSIVGYGDRATTFTAQLCGDVLQMYGRGGLLAAGFHADEPSVRESVHRQFVRLGVNDISPVSNADRNPLNTLRQHLVRAYQGKGGSNQLLLWVVDGEQAIRCASTLSELKREMHDLSIAVLCLLPPGGVKGTSPFPVLERLAKHTESSSVDAAVSTTILVDDQSPLYKIYGEPIADQLVARSLSGMLLAPLHNPSNPSFVAVARSLNQAGFAFCALAADSKGIVTGAVSGGTPSARPPVGSGSVSPQQALERTEVIAKELLSNPSTVTYDTRPQNGEPSLYMNFVVPISASSSEFVEFRGQISHFLAEQGIYLYSVSDGDGIDLSAREPSTKGDRYTQVGLLYGMQAPGR